MMPKTAAYVGSQELPIAQLGVLTRYAKFYQEKNIKNGSAIVGGWRLHVTVRPNKLGKWTSLKALSPHSFEDTYETKADANADLSSFVAWAEKGAAHRKNNPFVRSVNRGAAGSSSVAASSIIAPANFISGGDEELVYDLNAVHCKRKPGEITNYDDSPSDPQKIYFGTKKSRQASDPDSIYSQIQTMSILKSQFYAFSILKAVVNVVEH